MAFTHIRSQFPTLTQTVNGYPLCYLDTAATSHKPQRVLDAMNQFYLNYNANVHRAAHQLSAQATRQYESVRDRCRHFINAKHREEVIFTHGATEAINMVAHGLTEQVSAGSLILIDTTAHHANIVPWQVLAKKTGAIIKAIPLTKAGRLDVRAFDSLLMQKPAVVTLSHVSNALGIVNPVQELVAKAKAVGAITLLDGAQAVAHMQLDLQQLGCDFYVFSGHKMYGPTGVGVLYGRLAVLETLEPLLTGGEMIRTVSFEHTEYGPLPNRLEAGTPPIAEVIGLGEAIDFMSDYATAELFAHEKRLLNDLQRQLAQIDGVTLYAAHADNLGVVAFNLEGEHHQDVGILLDQQAIAIRCGHHCAMPLMQSLELKGCCRVSIGIYTQQQEIDHFIQGLKSVQALLD